MQDNEITKNQLKQLKSSYTSGVLRVRYGDTDVTYQSMVDMKKAINRLEKELGHRSDKITLFTVEYKKGL